MGENSPTDDFARLITGQDAAPVHQFEESSPKRVKKPEFDDYEEIDKFDAYERLAKVEQPPKVSVTSVLDKLAYLNKVPEFYEGSQDPVTSPVGFVFRTRSEQSVFGRSEQVLRGSVNSTKNSGKCQQGQTKTGRKNCQG